ncbi:hypothetical protein EB15_01207 [Enterococcus faecium]|nr:hypothetical protein EB15_01207 [Enterococcus faecium]
MNSMVFVNFPVADVNRSVAFYEKLGFKKNEEFSTEEADSMVWDDTFWVMLLSHDFYKKFIKVLFVKLSETKLSIYVTQKNF